MAAVDFWWVGWWGAGAGVVAVVRVAGVCGGGVRWGYDDSHGGHDDGVGWTHGHHLGHHLGHNLGTMWTSLGILRPVAMPNYSNCDPVVAKNHCIAILLSNVAIAVGRVYGKTMGPWPGPRRPAPAHLPPAQSHAKWTPN